MPINSSRRQTIAEFTELALQRNLEEAGSEGEIPPSYFELADEVGLAEADLRELIERGRAHYTRAREYAAQQISLEALRECRQAILVMPWDYSLMLFAADLALTAGITERRNDLLEEAELLARKIVEMHPDCTEAYNIIGQVGDYRGKTRNYIWPVAIAIVIMLLVGMGAAMFFVAAPGSVTVPPSETRIEEQQPGSKIAERAPVSVEESGAKVVAFGKINNLYDNSLVLRERMIDRVAEYLTIHFELENVGRRAVIAMNLTLNLLDEQGNLLRPDEQMVIAASSPAMYPGETRVFRYIKKVPANYFRYEPEVTKLNISSAPVDAPPAFEIEVVNRTSAGDRYLAEALSYKARRAEIVRYSTSSYLKIDLEATNGGRDILKLVKFEISFFDSAGNKLDSKERYLVSGMEPPIQPNEKRIFSNTIAIPQETDRYEIAVVEIDNLL